MPPRTRRVMCSTERPGLLGADRRLRSDAVPQSTLLSLSLPSLSISLPALSLLSLSLPTLSLSPCSLSLSPCSLSLSLSLGLGLIHLQAEPNPGAIYLGVQPVGANDAYADASKARDGVVVNAVYAAAPHRYEYDGSAPVPGSSFPGLEAALPAQYGNTGKRHGGSGRIVYATSAHGHGGGGAAAAAVGLPAQYGNTGERHVDFDNGILFFFFSLLPTSHAEFAALRHPHTRRAASSASVHVACCMLIRGLNPDVVTNAICLQARRQQRGLRHCGGCRSTPGQRPVRQRTAGGRSE